MNIAMPRGAKAYRKIGGAALTCVVAGLIGGLSPVSARADDYHHRDDRHYHHRVYRQAAPVYVQAPPPVYYAPPPRQPVIDFVIPLNFR